jgi:AcrR family transcriptional regulator
MAVGFTENEKLIINDKLKDAAKHCLKTYGVRKTTVEQLTKMAGISKGAFYNFYESKEILFFGVLEDFQSAVGEELIKILSENPHCKKLGFIDGIFHLFIKVKDSFLITLIENQDLEYLMRKLPQEIIANHHSFDDALAEKIFKILGINASEKIEVVSAALRAIFLTMLHEKEIGVHYEKALKVLITGVADEIYGEGN